MTNLLSVFPITAAILLAVLSAPTTRTVAAEDEYLWKFSYLKGQQVRVHSSSTVELDLYDHRTNFIDKWVDIQRVESVSTSGEANILVTAFGSKREPMTYSVTRSGLLAKWTTEKVKNTIGLEAVWRLTQQTPAPPLAVKIGEIWSTTIPNPLVEGAKVSIQSTLVARAPDSDLLTVKLQADIAPAPTANSSDLVHLDADYLVDAGAGRLVQYHGSLTNIRTAAASRTGTFHVTVDRIFDPPATAAATAVAQP